MKLINNKKTTEKNKKKHFIGFILSFILTIFPYYILINNKIKIEQKKYIILFCFILQILTQLICFLWSKLFLKNKWNLLSFLFTILIITILISCSLWIMYHLNKNMI